MRLVKLGLALLAGLLAAPALPQVAIPAAAIESPDHNLAVAVSIGPEGRANYTITRDGKPVIAPSLLGFLFKDFAYADGDRELVIVVHPVIVRDEPDEAQLWAFPAPMDLLDPHAEERERKEAAHGAQ